MSDSPTTLAELTGLADLRKGGQEEEKPGNNFPDCMPHTNRLIHAGITSMDQLREVDDLTDLEGIGELYASRIREAM